jgi:flagellar assembly factor FliW
MTIHVRTTRFDRPELVEVPDSALLAFPEGLPGFEELTSFALIDDPAYRPLGWLQALDDPAVRFVVIPRSALLTTEPPALDEHDLAALGLDGSSGERPELLWHLILTVGTESGSAVANLRAPVVVSRRTGRGKQVILADERLPLRHPLFPTRPAAEARACSS